MIAKIEAINRIGQQRQTIYAFLKMVYESELPEEFLADMPAKMKPLQAIGSAFPNAEANKAIEELVRFTDSIPEQNLDELRIRLAADYARLFLSLNKNPPHPSESVYREGTIMQFSRDEVLKTYWSFGVSSKKEFTEPEDHIAIELSFMAFLCEKANEALKNQNVTEAKRYIQAQKDFLDKHLARWVPKLVQDILNNAHTPFYQSAAVLTREFLEIDRHVTDDILNELKQ